VVFTINSVIAIQKTAITADEIIHIPAGYYAFTAAEFRMNAEHPPLAKMVAAIPLLFLLPYDKGPASVSGNFSQRGAQFYNHFWAVHKNKFLAIWFWSRVAMLSIALALGVLLFCATRQWFGTKAASLAVLFYSLEPTILGHSKVVHTDVASAFVYLLFFVVLYAYLAKPTFRRAYLLGLVTAIALATKFSMVVLAPVLGACFLYQLWRQGKRALGHFGIIAIIVVLAVNVAFGAQSRPLGADEAWIHTVSNHPALVVRTIETLSHVFPRDFLFGIYVVAMHNSGGDSNAILGQYSYTGWWYYFPVAFALKTPLPLLLAIVAGLVWAIWRTTQRDSSSLRILVPLAIYTALVMTSKINIGVRHFLPAYPFLIMLAAVAIAEFWKRKPKLGGAIAVTVVVLMAVETAQTAPYYLSYMNQLKGSQPGWRYLSDSNVEWGDAVPALAQFLRKNGERRVSGALLGGRLTMHFYDIEFVDLFAPPRPKTKYVALGASFLNGSTVAYGDSTNGRGTDAERLHYFEAYRNLKPVAVFGNSIYVYETPTRQRTDSPDRGPSR
jgi:4-amino-4-deoxy-L-arabinose transferase-like glycosyltransferase